MVEMGHKRTDKFHNEISAVADSIRQAKLKP